MKKNLSYIDSVHRDGRIWNIGVMLLLMAFPVAVCIAFSVMPDWNALLVGLVATAPMYWVVGAIETVTFVPMLILFIFVPALDAGTVGIMVPVSALFTIVTGRILYKRGVL